jgi:iron complex outermembrane receptor protein
MHPTSQRLTLAARLVALAVGAACSAPAAASTDIAFLPLEQLLQMEVTTASRYAQTALEAPAVVSVVTAEDIRTFGYRNLAEVLGSMRGLYVSYDRSYHYLGTRGFATPGDYNTRVLLLVNGARVNDSVYDQATIGTEFPIDLDLIDRVEFVPGPGSAVYGANAFFGVVNVITRSGRQIGGPQVSVEAGTHGAARARLSVGTRDAAGRDWLVSASRSSTRGGDVCMAAFDTGAAHRGVAQGLDFDRGTQVFARMQHDGLALTLAHGNRYKGTPTGAYSQVFNDPRSRIEDHNTRIGAEYTGQLAPGLEFTGRVHAGQYRFVGDYAYDYPPLTLNRDLSTGRWWGTELQWVSTAVARHKLSWGVDFRRDTSIRQFNDDLDPEPTRYLSASRQGSAVGVYVQDEFAIAPILTLHTGLRWGKQSGSAGSVNPRLGLVYLLDPSTAIKLMHGTAYRPPNAFERDYRVDLPGGIVTASNLRSEKVRTTELSLEHSPGSASRMLLTLFRSQVSDLLALVEAPQVHDRLAFRNEPGVEVRGMEAELERRWSGGERLRVSYGWQQAQARGGQPLANAARHLAKLQWSDNLALPLASTVQPGRYAVEAIAIGPRHTVTASRLPGRLVVNLLYTQRLGDADLSLGVYNLLNRQHADPASFDIRGGTVPQDGRTFRAKLTYSF